MYTFMRNHNANDAIAQEPYALGSTVMESAKTNLRLRYSLLKYMYGLFINKRGAGSIWRPLWFEFPADDNCYSDSVDDTQFLLGNSLMGAPIVEQGKTERQVFFPNVSWYDIHTGKRHATGTETIHDIQLKDKLPLYLREGAILYQQNTEKVRKVSELKNHFILLSGMHLDKRISDSTHKYFTSLGFMPSIADYNDDAKLEQCIKDGCEYLLEWDAEITPSQRVLHIDVAYVGELKLQESIFIDEVHLNLDGDVIVIALRIPIEITGPKRITLNVPKPHSSMKWGVFNQGERNLNVDEE